MNDLSSLRNTKNKAPSTPPDTPIGRPTLPNLVAQIQAETFCNETSPKEWLGQRVTALKGFVTTRLLGDFGGLAELRQVLFV